MGDFEKQTAVEKIGEGRYRAVLDDDWMLWGPAGGYVSAVALRAAGAAAAFPRPASYACQYLSFARFDEVELRVETLRAGKRTQALRVSMRQQERAILEAQVWAVGENEGLVHDHTKPPDVPAPDALPNMRELTGSERADRGFRANFESRPTDWVPEDEREPGEPVIRGWHRFRPRARSEEPFADAARALILIDTFSWTAIYGAHLGPSPWIAPNLDLHVRFHASAAAHDWLFCEGRAELAEDGLIGTHGSVWTRDRKLVAFGSSQLFCRPRPEQFR